MVGHQPVDSASEAPETTTTIVTTASRHADTRMMPLADQRIVRYGEGTGFDDETKDLPEHILEETPLSLSDTFQPDVNSLLGATALLCGMRRSGKSNGIAVMAEELGRYYRPLCIGDTETNTAHSPMNGGLHDNQRTTTTATAALSRQLVRTRASEVGDYHRRLGSHQDVCRPHRRMGLVWLHGHEYYRNPARRHPLA